jgi:hypothetical protein
LRFGFHPSRQSKPSDPRLSTGEAVLCRYTDDYGVLRMVKIHSNAHEWRQQMVNNQPNLLFRAYELMADSYYPKKVTDQDTYLKKFPPIGAPSVEEFRSLSELAVNNRHTFAPSTNIAQQSNRDPKISPISSQALVDRKNIESRDLRFRNAMLCYGLSVPLARQGDVFNLYNKVTNDRQLYLTFVCQNIEAISRGKYKEQVPERYHPAWDRLQGIVAAAKDFAEVRRKRGEPGRIKPMIMDNIRNLIMKEGGISLYRLISAYNYYIENKNTLLYN